jgi:pimeloyl-ACP methyl ester carboxylesterase
MPLEQSLRRGIENALADGTLERSPELVERILAHRLGEPFDMSGWQAQAMAGATFDVLDRLGEIQAPTLVVHGTEDHVVDVRNGELLAERIPNARLELFPGTGHLFFWEEPERFVQVVSDFLAEPA